MIEAASRERLPPLTDEAESFDAYVEHVHTNNLTQQASSRSATAAQIKKEAQRHRETRRGLHRVRGLHEFIEEPSWDVEPPTPARSVPQQPQQPQRQQPRHGEELPAGRFSDAAAAAAAAATAATATAVSSSASPLHDVIADFRLTPRAIKAALDEHVISQEAAKRALSVAVCDHYNFARSCLADPELASCHHVKPNILLMGPSGSGKTHLMRALARLLGVPFAKGDATKFSATGYVGGDVDDLVRGLLPSANGDVSLAEFGIVYIDEVDKLCEPPGRRGGLLGGGSSGVNTRDVQHALLKLMEDAEIHVGGGAGSGGPGGAGGAGPPSGLPSPLVRGAAARGRAPPPANLLRTRHVLFVFSGAFTGLEATLRTRQQQRQQQQRQQQQEEQQEEVSGAAAGGAADGATDGAADGAATRDVLPLASTADLVGAGLEPEFVGRIPVRVACKHLTSDDLLCVLRDAKDSVASQLVRDFGGYGIELELSECGLKEVAERAVREQTGARGLLTVLEETLRDFKFELPGTGVTRVRVDADVVRRPAEALEALLARQGAEQGAASTAGGDP